MLDDSDLEPFFGVRVRALAPLPWGEAAHGARRRGARARAR